MSDINTNEATTTQTAPAKKTPAPKKAVTKTKPAPKQTAKAPAKKESTPRVSRRDQIIKALKGTTRTGKSLNRQQIAEKTGSDSMTGSTCNALVEEKLLGVVKHEDSRQKSFYLTATGEKAASKL